jgi:hypothetical protein
MSRRVSPPEISLKKSFNHHLLSPDIINKLSTHSLSDQPTLDNIISPEQIMTMENHLDHLDDYASVDSSQNHRISEPSSSPLRIGNEVFDNTPEGLALPEFPVPPNINYEEHTLHGVHMHVQENAKIPNYNRAVDRSNSTKPVHEWNSLLHGGDDHDEHLSMAEFFLSKESSSRQSQNQQYESVVHKKKQVAAEDSTSAKNQVPGDGADPSMELHALTAEVDPTPWSEMKQNGSYNYYPYGRHEQLPIPNKPPSPTAAETTPATQDASTVAADILKNPTMQEAIATAAAIVSTSQYLNGEVAALESAVVTPATTSATTVVSGTTSSESSSSNSQTPATTTAASAVASNIPASSTTQSAQSTLNGKRHFQRISHAAPQHAQAHSVARVSVVSAANQKSQYGFGGNHKVPSVPAPPPMAKKAKLTTTQVTSALPAAQSERARSEGSSSPAPMNAGVAYERKKQRAKDARKLLNESIERLAIAISLAGSQSKQRATVLKESIPAPGGSERGTTLQMMEECVTQAEAAKKWDRPSFVGTAATLIQGLNSQCEGLMKELTILQEKCKANGVSTDTSSPSTSMQENGRIPAVEESYSSDLVKRESVSASRVSDSDDVLELLSTESSVPYDNLEVDEDKKLIFKNVAKFLDPMSLSRCLCVCKEWRETRAFEDDEAWLDLAVRRFGVYNVRQWTEKFEESSSSEDGLIQARHRIPKKSLYRTMCASMIMPHIQHEGPQSDVLLGSAKIPGQICAWVFMVERSNGETLRSVQREPGSGATCAYISMPVVTLRIVFQNIGSCSSVVLKDHHVTVDVSTRRSGGELKEIVWDDRFTKTMKNLDGSVRERPNKKPSAYDLKGELCSLKMYETVVLDVHIHAKGCSTLSKFQQRSNFCKILVCLSGTTIPLVVPFLREAPHSNHPAT